MAIADREKLANVEKRFAVFTVWDGPVTKTEFEAGACTNPIDPDSPPSIQAFCATAVYLDHDLLKVFDEDYRVTITTALVKLKSRGSVQFYSANPDDIPLVSPNL